jgi:FlaA1/EpsC-like NDP-sugar epimerase
MSLTAAASLATVDWDQITQRAPFEVAWDAVRAHVAGRVVLVTGAGGSLGAPLALALASVEPTLLVLLDHHEGSLFHLRETRHAIHPTTLVRAVLCDVRAHARVRRTFEEASPDLVFHLAAYKHVPWGEEDAEAFVDANVLGARAIVDAARAAGVARIVYPSTDKAIDPPSLYGATKRLVELLLYAAAQAGGPACSVARFVNVLGSRGSAPETFARQLAEGRALSVTDPAMRRYWITPAHARLLLLHAACLEERAVTVIPDAGDEIPVVEIARRMTRALAPSGATPDVAITGARPGERLSEPIVAAHERTESIPLPGILAVRGGTAPDGESVGRSVDRLVTLMAGGASNMALREAVFEEIRAIQSRP